MESPRSIVGTLSATSTVIGLHPLAFGPKNNTVKCFGCQFRPMGPIDLVMDVHGTTSAADAAMWIAERFEVPSIPARKRLTEPERRRDPVGYERGLGLLIRSGLWARLSAPARSLAAVLLEFGEKDRPFDDGRRVQMAYRTLARFSGVRSPSAIRKGLLELSDMGFLVVPPGPLPRSPDRESSTYVVRPNSNELWELTQTVTREAKQEIQAEMELRRRQRNERIHTRRGI